MPVIKGEHYIRCSGCCLKIYASNARKNYLGYWTCKKCWEEYPLLWRPLPKQSQPRSLGKKISLRTEINDLLITWDTQDYTWDTQEITWDNQGHI